MSLRVVEVIASHPLPTMPERGIQVTVNSDDPAYSGGYLDHDFDALTHSARPTRGVS